MIYIFYIYIYYINYKFITVLVSQRLIISYLKIQLSFANISISIAQPIKTNLCYNYELKIYEYNF